MRRAPLGIALIAAGPALAAERPADLVLANANVITLEDAKPRATVVAVREGRIVAVGGAEDIRTLVGPATRTLDLEIGRAHV